jgi:hypothetical protein
MFKPFKNVRSSSKYERHRKTTKFIWYAACFTCVGWWAAHLAVTMSPAGVWPHDLLAQTIIDAAASVGGAAGVIGLLGGIYKIWMAKK